MDYTAYDFQMRDGLPPDGEDGSFFGFDQNGSPYILKWSEDQSAWFAIGFEIDQSFPRWTKCVDECSDFITRWAFAPAILSRAA